MEALRRNWGVGVLVLVEGANQFSGIEDRRLSAALLFAALAWLVWANWKQIARIRLQLPLRLSSAPPTKAAADQQIGTTDVERQLLYGFWEQGFWIKKEALTDPKLLFRFTARSSPPIPALGPELPVQVYCPDPRVLKIGTLVTLSPSWLTRLRALDTQRREDYLTAMRDELKRTPRLEWLEFSHGERFEVQKIVPFDEATFSIVKFLAEDVSDLHQTVRRMLDISRKHLELPPVDSSPVDSSPLNTATPPPPHVG